jgi:hypothetical protein
MNAWENYVRELDLVKSLHLADVSNNLSFRLRVFLWKRFLPFLRHRDIHPRLGLKPVGNLETFNKILGG